MPALGDTGFDGKARQRRAHDCRLCLDVGVGEDPSWGTTQPEPGFLPHRDCGGIDTETSLPVPTNVTWASSAS